MVVAANDPINQYIGTGGTNTYPFTFPVFESDQLLLSVIGPGSSSGTNLVEDVDYLVSGLSANGDPASAGTITLINAGQAWLTAGNLTTDWLLTIQSNFAYEQTTSLRNQGDFYRAGLENALDNLEYQIQQLSMLVNLGNFTLTDTVTGLQYRILMVNGVLSTQQIT